MATSTQPAPAYLLFDIGHAQRDGQAGTSPYNAGTFAVDVRRVANVLEPSGFTSVPLSPPSVIGILNHHGRIVTVVDPAPMLDLAPQGLPVVNVVIVEHRRQHSANLGLQVASIRGIVAPGDLQSTEIAAGGCVEQVWQLDKQLVHIVALDSLVKRLGEQFASLISEGRASGQGVGL